MQLKPEVKRILRPAARLFTRAVDRALNPRLTAIEDAQREGNAVQGYLPAVLNAISSQHAVARELRRTQEETRRHADKQIHDLWSVADRTDERLGQSEKRLEFVRREVLFEARYGVDGRSADGRPEPKVVNPDKLAAAGDNIRLNLGAGHIPVEGYLNLDWRDLEGVDIVADVRDLPFGEREVSEIYSAHLLEHFPVEDVRRSLLPYWFSRLKPGGTFVAVLPDAETMLREYASGGVTFEELREVTFGGQEYEGDFHFNMYTPSSLGELLEQAGFVDVGVREAGRRNGLCYEMEIVAHRPRESDRQS